VTGAAPDSSYRALLSVPSLGRVLLASQVARIGGSMVGFAIVLFTLITYHSAPLAGLVTFMIIFPGLIVSPIAGALLDRHGRTRLVVLDYLVAFGSLALIGVLSLLDLLPAWLLLLIAALSSLTGPLSNTGLRSLFPLLVPPRLWERVNAVDANGYIVAAIVGPPLAAGFFALWGGPAALILTGSVFGLAALILAGTPDPPTETASTGRLLLDAWQGLAYAWRNPTIRGLGISVATVNLSSGVTTIVVPLIILERLHGGEATVGAVFAISGIFGVIGALIIGRFDSRGRERAMIALPMLAMGPVLALLLSANGLAPEAAAGSLAIIAGSMALIGLLNGPMDIGIFTIRQRRTDPAWMGRAFAVSISLNYVGFPVGSALIGWITTYSIDLAIAFGVAAAVVAGLIAYVTIPASAASHLTRSARDARPAGTYRRGRSR
jgi:MFS family permease